MVITLPSHRQPPAQSLFCGRDGTWEVPAGDRPAISMEVRESFTAHFAADFCAAMTERRHENDVKSANAA
ncbi:hypothetical protein GGQ88_002079 [Novosphingobium hassiacum]|uniref:Uncharacterized protein n=1 Tax=Novosphingobium hassiacum TaxID=173676 RepID=A0A7W6EWB4_9SPHN|nr:hypothetical protein [Novosphingobium hassiacum]MBB3860810.1 hypothetical protein [Novosphingobium hassiacum]